MTDTPPGMISSWVDLTSELELCPTPPLPHRLGREVLCPTLGRVTPPHWVRCPTPPHTLGSASSDYLRMLREAQSVDRTPPHSSLVSRCSSSPKSPPNSPNVELVEGDRLGAIYINRLETGVGQEAIEEFIWDWSSLPSNTPPKWTQQRSKRETTSEPASKKDKYSGRSVASLLLSNLVSLLLGASIGVWIYRRTSASRGLQILIA